MKSLLGITLLLICTVCLAQEPTKSLILRGERGDPAANPKESIDSKLAPTPLKLSPDDQKQLDLINERISQMKPQLEAARKQQTDAQAQLQGANAFIAEYNKVDAIRMAFLFRVAADVCGCKTNLLKFSDDGKSVVRKTEAELAKEAEAKNKN